MQKPHALKGEVKAVFQYQFREEEQVKTLYFGESSPLPFAIEQIYPIGNHLFILKTADSNDRNSAEALAGNKIHIPEVEFEKYFEKDEIAELIGYEAVAEGKTLGNIEDIFNLPHQHLAQVTIEGKEVLIPLNERTIENIDKKKKKIFLNLPEGLIEAH